MKGEKNYNKLFRILENEFPGWVSLQYIKGLYKLDLIYESDLEKLNKYGFLDMEENPDPKELKKRRVVKLKMFRLSPNGFNFINTLNSQRTNTILLVLTVLLTLIGGIQIWITLSKESFIKIFPVITPFIFIFGIIIIIAYFLIKK